MKTIVTKLMIAISAAMMLLGMSSCYTKRVAERQVDKAHRRYPLVTAGLCSGIFDGRDSVSVVKEYLPGTETVRVDSFVEEQYIRDTNVIERLVVRTVRKVDTVRDTRYVQVANKAELRLKEEELQDLREDNYRLVAGNRNKARWLTILGGLIAVYVLFRLGRMYLSRKVL